MGLDPSPRTREVIAKANVRGCRAAAVDIIDRDELGVILNTASTSSGLAQGNAVQYEATKGAVRMITRAALEFANRSIRVSAVATGQITTEIVEGGPNGS